MIERYHIGGGSVVIDDEKKEFKIESKIDAGSKLERRLRNSYVQI